MEAASNEWHQVQSCERGLRAPRTPERGSLSLGSVRWARGSPARTTALSLRRSPRYPVILLSFSSPRSTRRNARKWRERLFPTTAAHALAARRRHATPHPKHPSHPDSPSCGPSSARNRTRTRPLMSGVSPDHTSQDNHTTCNVGALLPNLSPFVKRPSRARIRAASASPQGSWVAGPTSVPPCPNSGRGTAYDRRPSRRTPTRRVCRLPTGPPTTPARAHRSLRRVQRPRGEVFVDELARQSDAGVRGQPRDSGRAATPTGAGCPEASAARCCPCPRSRWRTARRRRAISSLRSLPQRSTARRRRGAAWLVRRAASCKHGTGADGARDGARGGRRRVAAGRRGEPARRGRTRPSG